MKKFKIFSIAILLLFGGFFFTACKKEENVLCESISLSETEVVLMPGETIEINVSVTPENATQKQFELIGEYADIAKIECDFEGMKLIVTANDFITADITDAIVGVRTLDEAKKETHLNIEIVETNQSVATPQNLTFDGANIVWQAVDNASGYTLEVNGESFVLYQPSYPVDLRDFAGKTITAKVKANGKSSNLDSSFTAPLSFSILQSPKSLDYNDETKVLTWEAVENAFSYNVYIKSTNANGEDYLRPFNSMTNSLNIGEYFTSAGQYEVFVRANGNADGSIANSAFSNSAILTKLAAPENINIINGTALWSNVVGAVSYDVEYTITIDGETEMRTERVTLPKFNLPTNVDEGKHTFKIKANGDGLTTLTGDFGVENSFIKLETIKNLKVVDGKIVWEPNNLATNYTIHFKNLSKEDGSEVTEIVTMTSGADVVSYEIENYPAGKYQLDVVANGANNKISSDETGEPITVVKLEAPKHFQVNISGDVSTIEWDANEKAVGYKFMLNDLEEGAETIESYDTEKYIRVITSFIRPGDNYFNVMCLGGGYSSTDGVWYINSDFSEALNIVKLAAPVFNTAKIAEGDISWNSQNSLGFDSFTLAVQPTNSDEVIYKTLTQNSVNLNGLKDISLDLHPGDYVAKIKANAKANSNFYGSDYSETIILRIMDIETLSVHGGDIQDLENNFDENYSYRYFINDNKKSPVNSVNDYVSNISKFKSGDVISVYAQKVPVTYLLDGVYYFASNYSNTLYLKKLPTINKEDLSMSNGVLYYGDKYTGLSGFEFMLYVDEAEPVNKGVVGFHDFSLCDAGKHKVKIKANSIQEGDTTFVSDNEHPWFINSEIGFSFGFEKLEAPSSLYVETAVGDNETTISGLISSISTAPQTCGALVWKAVSNAIRYELVFENGFTYQTTNLYATLKDIGLSAGQHSVIIRAIGNDGNLISSDFAKKDDEVLEVSFTKLVAPSTLTIQNGMIAWSFDNPNDDVNRNLGVFDLISPDCKAVVYVLVDANGKTYVAFDDNSLNMTGENILADANSFISVLKSNSCKVPENLRGTTTLKIYAMPLNSYITSTQTVAAVNEQSRLVMSEYFGSLNLVGLETPLDFSVENRRISWSGQRYNVGASGEKPLSHYEIEIKSGEEKLYSLTIKEKLGAQYEIDAKNRIIYIDDLSNSDHCYWDFTKENFEAMFGEDSYIPNVYSLTIKSVANLGSFVTADNGLDYYYYDSKKTSALKVEILKNPVLSVEKGILVWNEIPNAVGYNLYISKTNGITNDSQYISLTKNSTLYDLSTIDGPSYSSGIYYFNIVAVGDGISLFTSEFDAENEKQFVKLDKINNIYIDGGIVKYSESAMFSSLGEDAGCKYTLFIRVAGSNDLYKQVDNELNLMYELGEDFRDDREYEILVRASGDNTIYLNSDLSVVARPSSYNSGSTSGLKYPRKLSTPSQVFVKDGKLYWSAVNNAVRYKLTISGENVTINTLNTFYDISNIPAGTYSISVKAIGDGDFLNSSNASVVNVVKLSDLMGLELVDGFITWDFVKNSNYVANIDGVDIPLDIKNSEIIDGKVYYSLKNFAVGSHDIYLYNNGGEHNISSSKTQTMNVIKLAAPTNLVIELNAGKDHLIFNKVANAEKYYVEVVAKFKTHDDLFVTLKDQNVVAIDDDKVAFVLANIMERANQYVSQKTGETVSSYVIRVVAAGVTTDTIQTGMYVASDASNDLIVTIPESPVVSAVYNAQNNVTGKIAWQFENEESYNVVDYYKVYVKNHESAEKSVLYSFDEELATVDLYADFRVYKVSGTTYANLVYAGTYDVIVVACQNKDGYDSTITASSKVENINYAMFGQNENGSSAPYSISNMEQFNAMQYNLSAKYILASSQFEIADLETIGTENEKFNGEFDGNNAVISVSMSNAQKFVGLFQYVGTGTIKNFVLQADIHSTTQIDGKIYVAAVAAFNYGTICDVTIKGVISSEYNSNSVAISNAGVAVENYGTISHVLSQATILPKNNKNYVYAGGIAAINYGTIEKSGFTGSATAQMVGGIASQNIGGKIDQCYYENGDTTQILSQNNGLSHNYAGGLVGYMKDGIITSSYVNAQVSGTTNSVSSNNTAYVGGLVGYIESLAGVNNGLTSCYVVGYSGNKSNVQIFATGTYSYAGVFVGDNKVDASSSTLICVMNDSVQSKIGNTKSSFTKAQVVTNISTSLRKLGAGSANFETVESSNYLKLKNAKYL